MDFIYQRKGQELMKVGFFFSGGASSLKAAFKSELHGKKYKIVFAFTDKPDASGIEFCQEIGLPVIVFNYKEFCEKKGLNPRSLKDRPFYFEEVLKRIEPFKADLIGLSGFMLIVTEPLLSVYKNRIFNIHPFRLDILTGPRVERLDVGDLMPEEVEKLRETNQLERKYKGEDAVYDGMISGEPYAQSTLHLATALFDEGPILVMSKKIYFDRERIDRLLKMRNYRPLRKIADAIQEEMKWACDGPAFVKALELAADGRLAIQGSTIFLDGKPLPYKGYQLS
jgi:folate-dependent phosphoribosylglycinamide formyltransferase PurN